MNVQNLAEEITREHVLHLRLMGRLVERFAAQGEDAVLLTLYELNRPVLSGEFMELLGLSTGRIANILKQLEREGNISRSTDTHDRRRVWVSLTEKGTKRSIERRQALVEAHAHLLARMDDQDAISLAQSLSRWLAVIEAEEDERDRDTNE